MGNKKRNLKSQLPSRRRSRRMAQLRRVKTKQEERQSAKMDETHPVWNNMEDVEFHENAVSVCRDSAVGIGDGEMRHIHLVGGEDSEKKNDLEEPSNVAMFCENAVGNEYEEIMETSTETKEAQERAQECRPEGRRLVDIHYLFEQILSANSHGVFGCNITDMYIVKETMTGLSSIISLKCKMCGVVMNIRTDRQEDTGSTINNTAALGIISSGIGYSTANELFSVLNVPFMTYNTFAKCQDTVADMIHTTLGKQIEANGKEESRLARLEGDVDANGVPTIAVIADGAWCKRSYNINYNASSGVACIIGQRTKKVLFLAVKNKYCCICAKADNKETTPTKHVCYRNFEGPSTAMETEIIVEGFKQSMRMHGVQYTRLVGDGDSSVYKKLTQTRPYGTTIVEKVECTNHLLRNFSKHLRDITTRQRSNTKNLPVAPQLRKLVAARSYRLVAAVKKAVEFRRNQNISLKEKIAALIEDMQNAPSHVFGEHKKCSERKYYTCEPLDEEINYVPVMSECGIYEDVAACFKRLITHAFSLLLHMTNNAAEQYNSIVSKFVGGKRINYSLKRAYQTRCEAAAISYNSGSGFHYIMHKELTHKSPRGATKKFINKMQQRRHYYKRRSECKKQLFKPKATAVPDEHYGVAELTEVVPDLTEEEYTVKAETFLEGLKKTREEIVRIEEETRGQAGNPLWFRERSCRITASMFKEICRMRKTTSCVNKVKLLLYSTFTGNENTRYGRRNEMRAIHEFEQHYSVNVTPCGFFIDEEYCMFGASPDGLVEDNAVVEVKCPAKASHLHPAAAIQQKIITCAKLNNDGTLHLKTTDKYYYQVQGQLHVTRRKTCYFVLWTPLGLLVELIQRDDTFWRENMETQLLTFYHKCLLPEIIDPRQTRGMEIRNPPRQ